MTSGYKNKIEVSVRAVIFAQGKLLVCSPVKKNYYFFPGGHVEFNELLEQALKREMREELGIKIKQYKLVGIVENRYTEDKIKHHEINFVFRVNINPKAISLEDHIDFLYLPKKILKSSKIYPINLQQEIIKNPKMNNFFWIKSD